MAFAERILAPFAHIRSKLRTPIDNMALDGVLQTATPPKKIHRKQMASAKKRQKKKK